MLQNYFKDIEPFSLNKDEKYSFFIKEINLLNQYHYKNSYEYKRIINSLKYKLISKNLTEIPFIPVRLFKEFNLLSVSRKNVFKVLQSSGTSGSLQSKIYLDRENAKNQTQVLSKILSTIIGLKRLPMLIIDQNPKTNDKNVLSAKSAAINGFSVFGRNHTFLLNQTNEVDYDLLNNFLENFGNDKFLLFGFTSSVYENLYKKLSIKKCNKSFSNGILLHGGGWKKMENIKVNNLDFKKGLKKKINLKNIYNYYGLVEQIGSIFFECEKCSCFITSIFSEVIVRDKFLNVAKKGEKGFLQLISLLPKSYPGHSILTEDIGEIINNDCSCKKFGTRFLVHGRSVKSEVRGCSDV